jgi:hypothetical protein
VGRFKVGLVAAALALPLAAPPAAAVAGQEAFAVWVRPEGKKLVAYFAVAERYVDPTGGGLVTAAGVAKGTCQRSGGRGFRMTLCSARGRVKEIPFEDFVVDPALGSATMTVTMAGRTHTVEWTAADRAPSAGAGVEAGPGGVGAGAGMGRYTRAEGKVFGARLTRRDLEFAVLSQSAGAGVGLPVRDDGTWTFSFRL